jgi:hypothetical protein
MQDQRSPKSWRHRLRLSVRAMMLLVLFFGGGLGWIIHRAKLQRDAVAAIRHAGGYVAYDWEHVHRPSWLEKLVDGTDQRLGVSFDQQDGSAVGGWTEYGVIGAYPHNPRHAVKCAEWCRTQDVA